MATIDQQLIQELIKNPPQNEKLITSDQYTGFGIRARRGRLNFVYRRKIAGRIKTQSLGPLPITRLEDALKRYGDLRLASTAPATAHPQHAVNQASSGLKLSELIEAYLEEKKSRLMITYRQSEGAAMKTTQYKEVERSLRHFEQFVGSDIPAAAVEREQIYECLNEYKKRYPHAARRIGKWICAMYSFGRDRFSKSIKYNPADRLKLGVLTRSRSRTLTEKEVSLLPSAILKAFKRKQETSNRIPAVKNSYPLFAIMQLLVLLTGQRGHGVRHMEHSKIRGDVWVLDAQYTKHHQYDEEIYLSTTAQELIHLAGDHTAYSPWVFPSPLLPDQPIKRHTLSRCAEDTWLHSQGLIQPYTIHDLRRTCATLMVEPPINCPRELTDLVLGHVRSRLERTYILGSYIKQKGPYQQAFSDHLLELWGDSYTEMIETLRAETSPLSRTGSQ